MDAKKLAGLLIIVVLAVPVIASASAGTLALVDLGLVGLLYVIRRQRSENAARRPAPLRHALQAARR